MQNELKRLIEQSRELWQRLSPRRRYILIGSVAGVLLLGAVLALRPTTEEMATLTSGLSDEDAAHVVEFLKAQSIPYKVAPGNLVQVPASRLSDARLGLALNDVGSGGDTGWAVFDKVPFGATSAREAAMLLRARQGELERTIRMLEPVAKARVHIAQPERSLFKEDERLPTAAVTVALKPGRRLAAGQIRGIVRVVASSVEGLSPEGVTLVDESGAVLWSGGGAEAGMEAQQELERALARRVAMLVETIVGPGHSQVVVTAEMDQSQTNTTDEKWDKDKAAVRSETKSDEKSTGPSSAVGGVAGAQGNLPAAPAPAPAAAGGSGGSSQKTASTVNYELNHIVTRTVGPKQSLKRLHVAVLVDQLPKPGAPGQRVPRSDAELKQIEALVRTAAGLQTERGDDIRVSSLSFGGNSAADEAAAAEGKGPLSKPLVWVAMAAPAVLLVLVLAFVLRRRRKKAIEAEELPMLPATVGELEKTLPDPSQDAPLPLPPPGARDRVSAVVRDDAARAAEVLSAWLLEVPAKDEDSDEVEHKKAKAS